MISIDKFFYGVHKQPELFSNGHMTHSQVDGLTRLINVRNKYFNNDPLDQFTYDIATSYHETARTMQPITERGSRAYFDKYEPGTHLGKMLGNTMRGDGYLFRGEGDVQNTGRANAAKATKRINEAFNLDIDLVAKPEMRGDPFISAVSLMLGNKEGWWTEKGLSAYLDGVDESDAEDLREFINARHVVNGTDRAQAIGEYALLFEPIVREAAK